MPLNDLLEDVFERGLRDGIGSLDPEGREMYYIQDFIIAYEMGGLSGYFYNRLPTLDEIRATVVAMKKHGLAKLSSLVEEASMLFTDYQDSMTPTAWNDVLRQYDPENRFDKLDDQIRGLDNYGIPE